MSPHKPFFLGMIRIDNTKLKNGDRLKTYHRNKSFINIHQSIFDAYQEVGEYYGRFITRHDIILPPAQFPKKLLAYAKTYVRDSYIVDPKYHPPGGLILNKSDKKIIHERAELFFNPEKDYCIGSRKWFVIKKS